MRTMGGLRHWIALWGVILGAQGMAQTAPDTYWIQFTDKANTPFSIDQPLAFLSERSVARRSAQEIPVDVSDLPVDPAYIAAVLALGEVELVNRSRWFNAITIRTTDQDLLDVIASLPFVAAVKRTVRVSVAPPIDEGKFRAMPEGGPRGGGEGPYGASYLQVAMMNGQVLHAMGARGQGLLVGVLDSGFEDADVLPAFNALHERDGVVFTADMVVHDADIYADHWHGRSVLACMAAQLDGELMGTAPDADYALVRTETVDFELVIEEDNWISGAELLDSLGADILNTSLGYTRFDDPEQDHSYAELDGLTTRISMACGMAAQKGMIPVVSAGNSGENEWFHISAPADAIDILSVGAVGDLEQPAPFSSRGPSADGRVKPDVAAMGWGTVGLGEDGNTVTTISGTSFAAPLVSGLVACLWQLHPDRTATQIMHAIRATASQASTPDAEVGHGIPDMLAAHEFLLATVGVHDDGALGSLQAFPVPFLNELTLALPGTFTGPLTIALHDMAGRLLTYRGGSTATNGRLWLGPDVLDPLPTGIYLLQVRGSSGSIQGIVVKQP